jgi:hypothetical protein
MNGFFGLENLEIIELEVSEEIEKNSLKNFISTSLELKNQKPTRNEKIILNYIEELKIYQIVLLKESFKNIELELFLKLYERYKTDDSFAFLYKNYFLIIKNNKIYYLHKIEENIDTNELLSYLNKTFKINFKDFKLVNSKDLEDEKENKLNNKIEFFELKKSYIFYFYILYLLAFSLLLFFYFSIEKEKNIKNSEKLEQNIDIESLENSYEFKSFEFKTREIIEKIESRNLYLENFEFSNEIIKFEISSKNKDDIYTFFEDKTLNFLSSKIDFVENQNIYKAVFDVELFK